MPEGSTVRLFMSRSQRLRGEFRKILENLIAKLVQMERSRKRALRPLQVDSSEWMFDQKGLVFGSGRSIRIESSIRNARHVLK